MAISTSGRVLYFDTVTAASVTGMQQIIGVFWVSEAGALDMAVADAFLLSDSKGNRIIGKTCEVVGHGLEVTTANPLIVDGITLTTLGGGVVYVWLK